MKEELALRLLSDIMAWDTARAREEFAWLSLMSRIKYDGYRDFVAGVRFVESLAAWLQQFESAEREAAYAFVRHHLVYVSTAEIQHLVELFYPETVRRRLVSSLASRAGIPTYRVWAQLDAVERYAILLHKTLFVGLSDGSRMDVFRRANAGVVSNEQVVLMPQMDNAKWASLRSELAARLGDKAARFAFVYLIDDFIGSGKTLLRKNEGQWIGKLHRFWESIQKIGFSPFEPEWTLCVHHYIGTHAASLSVHRQQEEAIRELGTDWFQSIEFSFGTVLPRNFPVDTVRFPEFMNLVEKYYDPVLETRHTEGDIRRGYHGGALPLVLEHNTPNNSVALIWAETQGQGGHHAMRPLFRRRQRHT